MTHAEQRKINNISNFSRITRWNQSPEQSSLNHLGQMNLAITSKTKMQTQTSELELRPETKDPLLSHYFFLHGDNFCRALTVGAGSP